MNLKDVLQGIEYASADKIDNLEIQGLSCDSKNIRPDFIFIAVKGHKLNGHQFIVEAVSRGAKAVISQDDFFPPAQIIKILVKDVRIILPRLAANFFNHPAKKLKVIGITGTNGKTTIAYLLDDILNKAGFKVGLIGTIQYRLNHRIIPATNTTPGPIEMQGFLREMADNNLSHVVMEVSSHALDQHRVDEIDFETAVFTNLTLDHLDYHKNFENYFSAKAKLFEKLKPAGKAVINIDDPYGLKLKNKIKKNILSYALKQKADIWARNIKLSLEGSEFSLITPVGSFKLKTKLIGLHNVYNILAVVGAAVSLNISLDTMRESLSLSQGAPGRLEPVEEGQLFKVFIDYAHTDDALRNVLTILKEVKKGKIFLLFGCGGDRDKTKRPLMARAASGLADWVVITSDNPRREEPQQIINEIERGIPKGFKNYSKILDREEAIEKIISMAQKDDIILIAGKGHENYQIFKDTITPFNDKEMARKYLRARQDNLAAATF